MTAEYRGQADVMRWCGARTPSVITNWIKRYPDEAPQPDVLIWNESSKDPIRGWLPEREAEWKEFAAKRAEHPVNESRRAARTADLIERGVAEGRIDPAEAVKLLRELIGHKP